MRKKYLLFVIVIFIFCFEYCSFAEQYNGMIVRSNNGDLLHYEYMNNTFVYKKKVGAGWHFTHYFPADWDGDGGTDLLVRTNDGKMLLYPFNETFNIPGAGREVGSGWNFSDYFPADRDGDGICDLVVRTQDGNMLFYPFKNTFNIPETGRIVGTGWDFSDYFSADWDGDGINDLVVIDKRGKMFFYPFKKTFNIFGAGKEVGTGWNFSDYFPADWDHDGVSDLVVREKYGRMLLYPFKGTFNIPGAGKEVGAGWNFDKYFQGDWDNDGKNDMLVRTSDGKMILYSDVFTGDEVKNPVSIINAGNIDGNYTHYFPGRWILKSDDAKKKESSIVKENESKAEKGEDFEVKLIRGLSFKLSKVKLFENKISNGKISIIRGTGRIEFPILGGFQGDIYILIQKDKNEMLVSGPALLVFPDIDINKIPGVSELGFRVISYAVSYSLEKSEWAIQDFPREIRPVIEKLNSSGITTFNIHRGPALTGLMNADGNEPLKLLTSILDGPALKLAFTASKQLDGFHFSGLIPDRYGLKPNPLTIFQMENFTFEIGAATKGAQASFYLDANKIGLGSIIASPDGLNINLKLENIVLGPLEVTGAGVDDKVKIDITKTTAGSRVSFTGKIKTAEIPSDFDMVLSDRDMYCAIDAGISGMQVKLKASVSGVSDFSKNFKGIISKMSFTGTLDASALSDISGKVSSAAGDNPLISKAVSFIGAGVMPVRINSVRIAVGASQINRMTADVDASIFSKNISFNVNINPSTAVSDIASESVKKAASIAADILKDYITDPIKLITSVSKKVGGELQKGFEIVTDIMNGIISIPNLFAPKKNNTWYPPYPPVDIERNAILENYPLTLNLNGGVWWAGTSGLSNYFTIETSEESSLKNPWNVVYTNQKVIVKYFNSSCTLLKKSDMTINHNDNGNHPVSNSAKIRLKDIALNEYITNNRSPDHNIWRHPNKKEYIGEYTLGCKSSPDRFLNIFYGQPVWLHTSQGWWNGRKTGEITDMGYEALVFKPGFTASKPLVKDGITFLALTHNDMVEMYIVDLRYYKFPRDFSCDAFKHYGHKSEIRNYVERITRYDPIYIITMMKDFLPVYALDSGIFALAGKYGSEYLTWDNKPRCNIWDVQTAALKFAPTGKLFRERVLDK